MFGSEMVLETILLPVHYHNIFNKDIDVLHEVLKGSETFTAVLKTLLPSAARVSQAENQVILSPNHHRSYSASSNLFTFLVFAMANNFADLNNVPIGEILKYLEDQTSNRLLQHVLSIPGPESEAFAEKLFLAAVMTEDARIVKVLLQKGLVANDLVCVRHGVRYTPLEYSSMVWNVEITRLLLEAKLDVNKSIMGEISSGGAMVRAFEPFWRDKRPRGHIPSELVHMLFEAGGKCDWQGLSLLILQGSEEVLDLLLDNAFKTKTYDQFWHHLVPSFTTECDNATATRIVTRYLKAAITIDHDIHSLISRQLDMIIDIAAQRGNLELVQMILRSGVSFTKETLTCAIRSKNKELIGFLLDNGAHAVASDESTHEPTDWYDEESPFPVSSPLSEAIRWGDAEIQHLLKARGAWSQIVNKAINPGEFEGVLIAASVQGEFTIVQKLLLFRPPNTHGQILRNALVAAIFVKEEAIVLTLLDAGADVNGGYYLTSDIDAAVKEGSGAPSLNAGMNDDFREERSRRGPALLEALLQKNEELVRLILDADMLLDKPDPSKREGSRMTFLEAAVEWGDLSIIKEVVSLGVHKESWALGISVKRKDLECTQLLVNAGVRISSHVLSVAVSNNDIEMVEYLFSVGAESADSRALLKAEALPNGLPMIERLLTEFARRYSQGKLGYGYGTFNKAIREGNLALVELLLDAKIHVHTGFFNFVPEDSLDGDKGDIDDTLLVAAIRQQHATSLTILQRLLDEIRNPNIVVQGSSYSLHQRGTALLLAIDTKDMKKVQLLIDAGADVNWPATKGIKRTPIQKAAEIGSFEITQLLIKQGGWVNHEPAVSGGATALQLAAIGGYIGIAKLLLDNDALVNAPSAKVHGRTALEGAAEHGRIDMLKLLCNAGAEFHGGEYEKARELAKKNGHMATWRYLEKLYGPREENSMDT